MIGQDALKKLPDAPGVYFFLGSNKEILYIGKATSLRDRVRSYFSNDVIKTRGRLIVDMVALAEKIDFTQTDSVLEALLLEANLIKTHLPKYNTKEKDNKSYNYVVFTDEEFPKVLTIRGRSLLTEDLQKPKQISRSSGRVTRPLKFASVSSGYKHIFGPFPHGAQLKEAMKIIRRIFPYSDNKCSPLQGRPCFNRQIGLCPGVCTGDISKEEYADQMYHLKLFFEGKKSALLKSLEKQMEQFAVLQEFEKAAEVRKTIFALTHIQDVALLKHKLDESAGGEFTPVNREGVFRIEAYDVAHSSGTHVVGVMVVVEDGEVNKSQYRKFKIKLNPGVNDTGALKEILRRRLGHLEWVFPNVIAVDGGQSQINAAEAVLKERGITIPVVSVVKDERHKPREIMNLPTFSKEGVGLPAQAGGGVDIAKFILLANAEAHRFAITYHRKKRDKIG
ncbi:MAG: GIY-YIG nuclease family protein [bacterium]|nr:GIY-YIG nuclease family protein [bacterium]